MTKTQINTLARALVEQSSSHIRQAQETDPRFGSNSWIAHMSASMVLAGLGSALLDLRAEMEKSDAPREKNC